MTTLSSAVRAVDANRGHVAHRWRVRVRVRVRARGRAVAVALAVAAVTTVVLWVSEPAPARL